MNFLNPVALFGLVAASIPLILHLLNLRKLKKVDFSSLRFLQELQKTRIRRLKLKQMILLILRTLIIAFLVFAFARPTIDSQLPLIGRYASTSAVILIDNSFSMDISDEFGNRWNQARNSARQLIQQFSDGDETLVLAMAGAEGLKQSGLTRNPSISLARLTEIKPTGSKANLESALHIAAKAMKKAHNMNRKIFIITDAQKNIANFAADSLGLFSNNVAIHVVPIGATAQSEMQNLSVDSINVLTQIYQIDKLVEVEAFIKNNSGSAANSIVLSLYYNDERVAQRQLNIPAGQMNSVTIAAPAQTGGPVSARVSLDQDALGWDNDMHFSFIVPDKPDMAIVGDGQSDLYFRMALGKTQDAQAPANITYLQPKQLPSVSPEDYDVIVLTTGPYLKSDIDRLVAYVEAGGSVYLFPDRNTEIDQLSELTEALGLGGLERKEFDKENPMRFSSVDKQHPLFEGVFKGTTDAREIAESPNIYMAFLCKGGQTIINTSAGAFLSENLLGNGKAIYCAVPPTTEWSSLPLTGIFPALSYRSIAYLASKSELGKFTVAGQGLRITLPNKFNAGGNFRIEGPEGYQFYQQAVVMPSGAALSLPPTTRTGCYTVFSPSDKASASYAVNHDKSESDMTKLSARQTEEYISRFCGSNGNIYVHDDQFDISSEMTRAGAGSELWQLFIILAILCAVAEMLVARNSKNDMG